MSEIITNSLLENVNEYDRAMISKLREDDARIKLKLLDTSRTGNLIYEDMAHEMITSIFKLAVDTVSHTLGVYGRNSLVMSIDNELTWISASKDGDDNIKQLRFSDTIPSNILDLIRGIVNHMHATIGDSTTSGLPIGYNLYKGLYYGLKKKQITDVSISPAGIANVLDGIEKYLNENYFGNDSLTQYKRIINLDSEEKRSVLTRVGATSANGNFLMAEKVASLYQDTTSDYDSFVQLDVSPLLGTEDQIVNEKGFELDFGMVSKEFYTEADGLTAKYEKARIAIFDGILTQDDYPVLRKIINGVTTGIVDGVNVLAENLPQGVKPEAPSPLIIIATGFESAVEAACIRYAKGLEVKLTKEVMIDGEKQKKLVSFYAPIVLMRLANNYEVNKAIFEDLRVAVGAETFPTSSDKLSVNVDLSDPEVFRSVIMSSLGKCERVIISTQSCAILGGGGHEAAVAKRIDLIKKELDSYLTQSKLKPSAKEANFLRRRISMLRANIGKIIIGGADNKEKSTKRSIYDDITRAIRSTISSDGITLSGNVGLVHYLRHNKEKMIEEISKYLLDNKFNVTIGNKKEVVEKLVGIIIDIVADSFTKSYKKALLNAYASDTETDESVIKDVDDIYEKCMENPEYPQVYNLSTDAYESLTDFDNCNLLVPRSTDKELVFTIFAVVKQLVTSEKIVAIAPLDIDFEALKEAFLSTGQTGSYKNYKK